MDILALRELCDECLTIDAKMASNNLTETERADLAHRRAITMLGIFNQVNGSRHPLPPEIS